MKALDHLRIQMVKDYPGDKPAFGQVVKSPEEIKSVFENLVVPAFEKIKLEFAPFHFRVDIKNYSFVTRLDIKDGCSYFSLSVKISRKFAVATLTITYRDNSICSYNFEERILLEERFDLSRIFEELPEELIIIIFSDIFLNRKAYLKRIVDAQYKAEQENKELLREERRAKLINLKRQNKKFDPREEYKKYLDSPEFEQMMTWVDVFLELPEDKK